MGRIQTVWLGIASLSLIVAPLLAHTEGQPSIPEATCKTPPPTKGKSRQRFDLTAFMVVAGILESQGEKNFRLIYDPPNDECLIERMDLSGQEVKAIYNPWEKGTQTLLYRFVTGASSDSREVLVLYSGMVGFVAKGYGFHVTETRNGVVSFYAMFKEEPTYQAVKGLAADILSGSAKPLLAVRWPEGAKEGEVVAFDSSKLK